MNVLSREVLSNMVRNQSPEEKLELTRAKHLFVQWLVCGNRKAVPAEAKCFTTSYPDEAKALYDRFRQRSRRQPKGKKHLFSN